MRGGCRRCLLPVLSCLAPVAFKRFTTLNMVVLLFYHSDISETSNPCFNSLLVYLYGPLWRNCCIKMLYILHTLKARVHHVRAKIWCL